MSARPARRAAPPRPASPPSASSSPPCSRRSARSRRGCRPSPRRPSAPARTWSRRRSASARPRWRSKRWRRPARPRRSWPPRKPRRRRARAAAAEARAALSGLARERQVRGERRTALEAERTRWATRIAGADRQVESLAERCAEAERELAGIAEVPALIAEKREALRDELIDAERPGSRPPTGWSRPRPASARPRRGCATIQAGLAGEREARARTEARLEAAACAARRGRPPHPRGAAGGARRLPSPRRTGRRRRPAAAGRGRPRARPASRLIASASAASICRPRRSWTTLTAQLDQHGDRARRRRAGHQQAAWRHRGVEPRGPANVWVRPSTPSTAISSACSRRCSTAARRAWRWSSPRIRWRAASRSSPSRPARSPPRCRCCRAASRR